MKNERTHEPVQLTQNSGCHCGTEILCAGMQLHADKPPPERTLHFTNGAISKMRIKPAKADQSFFMFHNFGNLRIEPTVGNSGTCFIDGEYD